MKNIVLFCAAGMSTSLLVTKMQQAADASGFEATIAAHPIAEAEAFGKEADIVLLGPQVRHILRRVTKLVGDQAVVDVIDGPSYGRCDGAAVLKQAEDL